MISTNPSISYHNYYIICMAGTVDYTHMYIPCLFEVSRVLYPLILAIQSVMSYILLAIQSVMLYTYISHTVCHVILITIQPLIYISHTVSHDITIQPLITGYGSTLYIGIA